MSDENKKAAGEPKDAEVLIEKVRKIEAAKREKKN